MSAVAKKPSYSRKFPRYRIYDFEALKVTIESQFYGLDHTVILGAGGCGVYGESMDERLNERLKLGKKVRVTLHIQLSGLFEDPVEVQANVLYMLPMSLGGKLVYYYGLEFIPAHRKRVSSIVREIEDLSQAGKIMID